MAEAEQNKPPRRVRKVETVRDIAEKAGESASKPSRKRRVARAATKPLRPVGRGLARAGRTKPLHILGLVLVPRYFRNSWKELRQVTWPNGRESRRLTLAVILFATVFGLVIALVDYGLDKVFKQVLLK